MKSLISRYLVHNLTLIILFSQSPSLYHFVLRLSHFCPLLCTHVCECECVCAALCTF